MRKLTITYQSGATRTWEAVRSNWGDQSRNIVLSEVATRDGEPHKARFVCIPLDGVLEVSEVEY